MTELICPTKREANGWKIAIVLAEVLLGALVTFSILQHYSSGCIRKSLHSIDVKFAEHRGEHKGIAVRIERLEARSKRRFTR